LKFKIDENFSQVGDHIEKLDGINVVGKRHYEVARMLKDIPTGSTFTMRLVEPTKSGFQGIAPRAGPKGTVKKGGYGSGKETLRFKANGNVAIEDEVNFCGNFKCLIHYFMIFSRFDSMIIQHKLESMP
jgi:hypothetical protein